MFLIFEREYSTGVSAVAGYRNHRLDAGVAVGGGAIDIVAALSFINILLVVIGRYRPAL